MSTSDPLVEQEPPVNSGFAVASLGCAILGILSLGLLFPFSIVGWVLGNKALEQIDNPANGLKGRGMAAAGLNLSRAAVVLGVISVAVGVLLPATKSTRGPRRQMQNGTQVRGIEQGMIIFSQGNNTYFPGLTATGELAPATVIEAGHPYGAASSSVGPNAMAMLLNGNYFVPGYLVSPEEGNSSITVLVKTGLVTPRHYSYTFSRVTDLPADKGRHEEWKDNTNTAAVVVSDRVLDSGGAEPTGEVPPARRRSNYTSTNGDWRGSVVFGDNSTQFLTTSTLTTTRYGTVTNQNDDLFTNDGSDPTANALQVRE